jgi:hypothetical protein
LGDLPYSCGSPLNPSPAGDFRLPSGKHESILTELQTIDKKKKEKKSFFLTILEHSQTGQTTDFMLPLSRFRVCKQDPLGQLPKAQASLLHTLSGYLNLGLMQ